MPPATQPLHAIEHDDFPVKMLSGREGVRKRPGMYIGDTCDGSGLHRMIFETVDNAIEEAWRGFCDSITVTLHPDDSLSVSNNGHGMSLDIAVNDRQEPKRSIAEMTLCELHMGDRFDRSRYKPCSGLHRVGICCVNALSDWLQLTIQRDGKKYAMAFCRGERQNPVIETVDGIPAAPIPVTGEASGRGSEIHFLADRGIFGKIDYDFNAIAERLSQLSYLNDGLEFRLVDLRHANMPTRIFAHDMKTYIRENGGRAVHDNVFHAAGNMTVSAETNTTQEIRVETAMQWGENETARICCFTNGIPQPEGGAHFLALRTAITATLIGYLKNHGDTERKNAYLTRDSISQGLHCLLMIEMAEPRYSGCTKAKLWSPEVKPAIIRFISRTLSRFLERHPDDARAICDKITALPRNRYKRPDRTDFPRPSFY